MEGRRVLRSLTLKNVLSFGPEGQTLAFEPLNVLIGPNGSGKTNLIEVIELLRALPDDLARPIREGGGIQEWLWKGSDATTAVEIDSVWEFLPPLRIFHRIALGADQFKTRVVGETLALDGAPGDRRPIFQSDEGQFVWFFEEAAEDASQRNRQTTGWLSPDRSLLASRLYAADGYCGYLADQLGLIRLFRGWTFGPRAQVRNVRRADEPSDFLLGDASNLGLVLNSLTLDRRSEGALVENLRRIYQGVVGIRSRIVAGYVETLIEEEGGRLIPFQRLSDGTLRYLSLLAILCHPSPPPLLCIEEPELGLHPDVLPTIARLLVDASQRTQLIVTTHSAEIVSALGDTPEAVVVCERRFGPTTLERLEPDRMRVWLEKYSLGELWSMGEIGGNRW